MRLRCCSLTLGIVLAAASAMGAVNSAPGVPVSVLITLESKAETPPVLLKENVIVRQDKDIRPVTDLQPLEGGATQMLLLIDDSAGGGFDSQIPQVKHFIESLAANVEVAIGYMHNGTSQMVSGFTLDHQQAARSIRVAEGMGGADVSPYDSLSDAIKKWPAKEGILRKEAVLISSGIEGLGGGLAPDNPYVNAGISSAQKAGVTVFAIYNPTAGHLGHSLWQATSGQNLLSQLTDETGGELYWLGTESAVSFDPYFADILKRQSEQYILTFEARAEKKNGLQPVKIRASAKSASLAAPDKVFVRASL